LSVKKDKAQAISRDDIVQQFRKINRLLQDRKERTFYVLMGGNVKRKQKELEKYTNFLMETATIVSKHDWQRIVYEEFYSPLEFELMSSSLKDADTSLNVAGISLAGQLKEWEYKIATNSPIATIPFQTRFRGDNVLLSLPEDLKSESNYWELGWSWDNGGYVVARKNSTGWVSVAIPGDLDFAKEFYLQLLKAASRDALGKFEESSSGITGLIKEQIDVSVKDKMRVFQAHLDQSRSSGLEEWKGQRVVAQAGNDVKGGIDLNAAQMTLSETGHTAGIAFDPAMLAQFQSGTFTGIMPVITRITPVPGFLSMLGLKAPSGMSPSVPLNR